MNISVFSQSKTSPRRRSAVANVNIALWAAMPEDAIVSRTNELCCKRCKREGLIASCRPTNSEERREQALHALPQRSIVAPGLRRVLDFRFTTGSIYMRQTKRNAGERRLKDII